MAVVAVWKCDRDGAMFDNKKEAEEHDKMLELAANITALIERHIDGINEQAGEEIGLLLARHRDALAKACKGKPEVLLEQKENSAQEGGEETVTPFAANQ
ncbi:YebG family protein [Microbulbifer sp. 2205BS26-8]|uniref:YebG family protein n=1 Tax=Microbulbifer sp. 2205BS26-8 TaxID=3064386 RepID=UPI00273F63C5|nr:YebG family protein [Microbulbifer sp. 2205BS26-8]MDP5208705.1 YebG family protein [Microbulbifer sp. 2205BS26-8]